MHASRHFLTSHHQQYICAAPLLMRQNLLPVESPRSSFPDLALWSSRWSSNLRINAVSLTSSSSKRPVPTSPDLSRSVIEIDAVQHPSFRRRRVRVLDRS